MSIEEEKKSAYKVISVYDIGELETSVNESINEGWKCQGGVAYEPYDAGKYAHYIQAMVKED